MRMPGLSRFLSPVLAVAAVVAVCLLAVGAGQEPLDAYESIDECQPKPGATSTPPVRPPGGGGWVEPKYEPIVVCIDLDLDDLYAPINSPDPPL